MIAALILLANVPLIADFNAASQVCGVDVRTYAQGAREPAAIYDPGARTVIIKGFQPEPGRACLRRWAEDRGLIVLIMHN